MTRNDIASAIAREHLEWCRENGVTIADLLESIHHCGAVRSRDQLIAALATAWLGCVP